MPCPAMLLLTLLSSTVLRRSNRCPLFMIKSRSHLILHWWRLFLGFMLDRILLKNHSSASQQVLQTPYPRGYDVWTKLGCPGLQYSSFFNHSSLLPCFSQQPRINESVTTPLLLFTAAIPNLACYHGSELLVLLGLGAVTDARGHSSRGTRRRLLGAQDMRQPDHLRTILAR